MKLWALVTVAHKLNVHSGPVREAALRGEFVTLRVAGGRMVIPDFALPRVEAMAKAGCFSRSPRRRAQAIATFTFDDTAIPESVPELVTA